jgi:hypothetical protein
MGGGKNQGCPEARRPLAVLGREPISGQPNGDADAPPNLLLGDALNGRFWAIADKSGFWPGTVCPLMTHSVNSDSYLEWSLSEA